MKKPYIIAEIGVNYYDIAKTQNISLMEAAKIMVNEAKKSGASAVKFQSYKAEKIASKNSPSYWDTTKEPTTNQYDLFKKFDSFGESEYIILSHYCNEIGIDFMSTPFDLESVDYLDPLVKLHKISSSDITNTPLIRKIAKTKKKILLSTGASTNEEIQDAIDIIEKEGNSDVVLLHCILNYPTENKNANLNMIENLKNFNKEVGYSDHTLPDEGMLILTQAVMMGSSYIEKHFTLDKSLPGNDHYHAMDPKDLLKFASNLELLLEIGGSTLKTPLDTEEISRKNARRSVYLKNNLKKGTILTKEHLICKRPAHGISAKEFDYIIGKELKLDIKKDIALQWEMILN